jgi:hypothetical protein
MIEDFDLTLELINEEILSNAIKIKNFYHISFNGKLEGVWTPKVPDGKSGSLIRSDIPSEPNTPRISISTSIEKCFQAIFPNVYRYFEKDNYPYMEFFVYSPIFKGTERLFSTEDLIDGKLVHDAHMTKEYCVLDPVFMKLKMKIKVFNTNKNRFLSYHPFNDKNSDKKWFAPSNIQYEILETYK